jgi:hypothetical protein
MAETIVTNQTLNLLPEYQERFIKDLLANLYRTEERQAVDSEGNLRFETDPETGEQVPVMESYAAGIGSMSALYGTPRVDEEGNPLYRRDPDGNLVLDARGQPIPDVVGGIPRPDVLPFTDTQLAGLKLGVEGIGAYAPMLEEAKQTYESGISALGTGFDPVTGQALTYDPLGQIVYDTVTDPVTGATKQVARTDPVTGKEVRTGGVSDFYDPFVEDVIDVTQAEIQRAGDIDKIGERARAVGAGAFGGSRQAVAESELQRNIEQQKARTGAQLRSAGYTDALKGSQTAFENQLSRGQSGAQVFQGLGSSQAGLGQFAQLLGGRDVKSLMDLGGIEQTQMQSEYDVQRQAGIEEMYEPFTRFESLANIFATATRGTPSSSLTLGVAPEQNVLGSTVGTAMGLDSYQQMYGGSSGLGAITNR